MIAMCSVIQTGPCPCHTSTGITADDVLGVAAAAGIVTLGSVLIRPVAGIAGLVGITLLALAPNWSRRLLGRALRRLPRAVWLAATGAVFLAVSLWRRRHPSAPSTAVALPQAFRATVYWALPDGSNKVLRGPAEVPGVWDSQDAVERELVERWVAVHGRPNVGVIGATAYPVGGGR